MIYPPVDVSGGHVSGSVDDDYLLVSQFVGYKRVDLAIEACNRLGRPLRIAGDGEEYKRLRSLAGRTVQFLGYLPEDAVRENYAHPGPCSFPARKTSGWFLWRRIVLAGPLSPTGAAVRWRPSMAFCR